MVQKIEVEPGKSIAYLVTEPNQPVPAKNRWMLVYLYGAGGSIKDGEYNLSRPPYAKIRQALAGHGAYTVVPDLGPTHFMNDLAKRSLSKVIKQVSEDHQIDPKHVHLMGTSMGGGSSLAYAINHPDNVRSVCAFMPMTDFVTWIEQSPNYGKPIAESYGGTPQENPQAYDVNNSIQHANRLRNIPVLLLHGSADVIVPVSHSRELSEKLISLGYDCTYIEADGATHADETVTDYQDQVVDFLLNAEGVKKK